MRKSVKLLSVLMMIAILTITVASPVFATQATVDGVEGAITYGDSSSMQAIAGKILGFIRNVAIIGGVVIIAILGVKYMMGR